MRFLKSPILLTIPLAACGSQQPTGQLQPSQRDLFEMRQQCAESVPRVLKYAIDYGEHTLNLRTHYNSKLNRCYVLLKWQLDNPDLPVSYYWTIADAQSLAHVEVKPGDATWRAAFEDADLDAVVPGAASGAAAKK
jgi:hypothetical protein